METKSERNRKRRKTRRVTRSRNARRRLFRVCVCVWGGAQALKSGPKSGSVGPLGRSVWGPSALQRPISKRRFKKRVEDARSWCETGVSAVAGRGRDEASQARAGAWSGARLFQPLRSALGWRWTQQAASLESWSSPSLGANPHSY